MDQVGVGEAAALLSALCWAVGGVLFSRVEAPPGAINLFKNAVSLPALGLVLWAVGGGLGGALRPAALMWLLPSAVVGLVFGDTFHFRSIQHIGPRRAIVLETLAPVFAAGLGYILLDERLRGREAAGMVLTLLGVILAVLERPATESGGNDVRLGVLAGAAAALSQAVGAALSKRGMLVLEAGGERAVVLQATTARLLLAVVVGAAWARHSGRLGGWCRRLGSRRNLGFALPASMVGTALGIAASMLAFQKAPIAVATTLCATTPVLVLPVVLFGLREPLGVRAVGGAALAVAGVAVLVGM